MPKNLTKPDLTMAPRTHKTRNSYTHVHTYMHTPRPRADSPLHYARARQYRGLRLRSHVDFSFARSEKRTRYAEREKEIDR